MQLARGCVRRDNAGAQGNKKGKTNSFEHPRISGLRNLIPYSFPGVASACSHPGVVLRIFCSCCKAFFRCLVGRSVGLSVRHWVAGSLCSQLGVREALAIVAVRWFVFPFFPVASSRAVLFARIHSFHRLTDSCDRSFVHGSVSAVF